MGVKNERAQPKAGGVEAFGGLKISWLQAFLAYAETGKLIAAAQDLEITEGAVSKQIKALEEWARTKLWHKVDGEFALTDAGADFLPVADSIVRQLKAFRPPEWDFENGGKLFQNVTL